MGVMNKMRAEAARSAIENAVVDGIGMNKGKKINIFNDNIITNAKDLICDLCHLIHQESGFIVQARGTAEAAIDLFEGEVADDE